MSVLHCFPLAPATPDTVNVASWCALSGPNHPKGETVSSALVRKQRMYSRFHSSASSMSVAGRKSTNQAAKSPPTIPIMAAAKRKYMPQSSPKTNSTPVVVSRLMERMLGFIRSRSTSNLAGLLPLFAWEFRIISGVIKETASSKTRAPVTWIGAGTSGIAIATRSPIKMTRT